MSSSFSRSDSSIFDTGMPVQRDTTEAISSSPTLLISSFISCMSALAAMSSCFSSSGISPVLQLRHAREIAGALRGFEIETRALQFFLDVRRALQRGLFRLPDLFQVGVLAFELRRFRLPAPGAFYSPRRFPSSSLPLDLELDQAAFEPVHFFRLGIDLHADRLAASSIRSIALSGNCRSVM